MRPRRLFTFVSSPLPPTTARHLSLCVALYTHTRCAHISTETYGGFCPVIWHIFDVESKKKRKKDKMSERVGRGGRGSNLGFPLQWKALFVEHPHAHTHSHNHPSISTLQPLPSLPSKAWVDFSLNAIRNVTGPIHGQMEGWLCGWRPMPSLENDRNLACRWRSGQTLKDLIKEE